MGGTKIHSESNGYATCCNDLVGDEFHYLFVCHEFSLRQRRQIFINDILKVNANLNIFDKKSLFNYILSLSCSIVRFLTLHVYS